MELKKSTKKKCTTKHNKAMATPTKTSKTAVTCTKTSHGSKIWEKKGTSILHREDGPAIETVDGYKEWWLDGKRYSEKNHNKEIARRNLK